jgi:hypothetical protein
MSVYLTRNYEFEYGLNIWSDWEGNSGPASAFGEAPDLGIRLVDGGIGEPDPGGLGPVVVGVAAG